MSGGGSGLLLFGILGRSGSGNSFLGTHVNVGGWLSGLMDGSDGGIREIIDLS
jgi:hypothetical protein